MEQRKAYDMLDPGRGRPDLDHRHARDAGQDRHPDRRHRRRACTAAQAVLAALLRRWRTGEGATIDVVDARRHGRMDGPRALHADAHRQPAAADGPEPQLDRPLRRLPDQRRRRCSSACRTTAAGARWSPRSSTPRNWPTIHDSPPTSQRVRNRPSATPSSPRRPMRWTTAELDARLAAAGIPAAQIKDLDQVVDHPQLRRATAGARSAPSTPRPRHCCRRRPSPTWRHAMGDVPALGQHTHALLARIRHGRRRRRRRRQPRHRNAARTSNPSRPMTTSPCRAEKEMTTC